MKYPSIKKGFTLIELLVVIAIIAILTAIVTANFTQAKAKSRDAKRISDIAQIQLTLEMAFDRCNAYPADIVITTDVCTDFPLSYFISKMPQENATTNYYYKVNTAKTDYVLRATLETNSSSLVDAVTTPSPTDPDLSGEACGHASAPYYYCVQPK